MPRKTPMGREPATRVLVVDDSPVVRRMVAQMLADAGYRAESVPDGRAALRAMEAAQFDVVVTDLHIPPPDGFGLIEAVRARDPTLPVIILTGSHAHDVNAAVRAMRLGAQDYLTKPLAGPDQMILAVERALAQRRQLEALRESQKMEAIGRLAGGIAHDFNNALGIILGTVSLLARDPMVQGRVAADVEKIGQAAERAARLTRQLLAFSCRQVLQPRVIDLNQTLRDMRELLQSLMGETVHLSLDLADGLGATRVDRGQVEQAVTNIVMNACDALPAGGHIKIETANVDVDGASTAIETPPIPSGRYVCLSVSDDGMGIDPAVKARLFEPFVTTKGRDPASGLGLAVVMGIVTQHGGHVRVESEPGRGATFRLYFQRLAQVASSAVASPAEGPADTDRAVAATILLVEDDSGLRTLLCRGLRLRGYSVLNAWDGPSALALIERHTGALDLLVSDVVMPGGMSGFDLAKEFMRERPAARVLLISGYPQGGPPGSDARASNIHFLDKPFTIDVLAAKVREVLQRTPEDAAPQD